MCYCYSKKKYIKADLKDNGKWSLFCLEYLLSSAQKKGVTFQLRRVRWQGACSAEQPLHAKERAETPKEGSYGPHPLSQRKRSSEMCVFPPPEPRPQNTPGAKKS